MTDDTHPLNEPDRRQIRIRIPELAYRSLVAHGHQAGISATAFAATVLTRWHNETTSPDGVTVTIPLDRLTGAFAGNASDVDWVWTRILGPAERAATAGIEKGVAVSPARKLRDDR